MKNKIANNPTSKRLCVETFLNRVHQGDCIEVMNRMPAASVDLIVTSPPYNLRNSTGGGMRNGSGGLWKNAALLDGYTTSSDDMPYPKYVAWQRKCLTAMMRLLKPEGAIFYNHKGRVQDGLLQDPREIIEGLPLRQTITWERAGGINFNPGYFLPTTESIYLICNKKFRLAKSKDPAHPKATCAVGDVWRFNQDVKNPHPAPFPVELAKRCIESTDAMVILDPFMGSGTTAIAAEMLGRDWIGIDISKHYCEMASERIKVARDRYISSVSGGAQYSLTSKISADECGLTDCNPLGCRTLAELETIIETGKLAYIAVGSALREIRNRKLYKATHSTFEDYCLERWGFTRSTAYRNIRAANVARVLQNAGEDAPPSPSILMAAPRSPQRRVTGCTPPSLAADVRKQSVCRSRRSLRRRAATDRSSADDGSQPHPCSLI
jgi:site-specific DNA-methyltransferase (adenine-specific)